MSPRDTSRSSSSRSSSPSTGGDRLLRIYMTDQLALGVLWREIARRACNSSYGSPEGVALTRVASAIAEDVERLVERARSQRAELEPFHAQAAQAALR